MVTVRTSVLVPAKPEVVWEDLRHIGSHSEWMSDAVAIRFLSDTREGVGVRFECDTRIGPFRLTDRMEVTQWRVNEAMVIRHTGLVTGTGCLQLFGGDAENGTTSTRVEWTETLRFPWWMGGAVGAAAAKPLLRAVWTRNLNRLASRF